MSSKPETTAAATGDTNGGEPVVGMIQGDRVCISCGFNLSGQRIVRESKYNLLIARCPECGQAAALQEYPLLGRWANRWAATMAGVWLFSFFVLSIGCGMAVFGLSVGTLEVNGEIVEHAISNAHRQWWHENNPDSPNQLSRWAPVDPVWWAGVDQGAIIEPAGSMGKIVSRSSQSTWMGMFFAMIPLGCLGSVALLGVSRSRLALAAVFPVVIAALACTVFVRANFTLNAAGSYSPSDLARAAIWHLTIPTTVILGGVFLIIGMLLGRPLARLMARTALPNRFVQALSALWTCDGIEPPKPRR